ncbi:hypothetical protein ACH5RR_025220 [Cinchona calisaya]|uniref:Uncharacterized protein n=1 Tax=Cinchona calisaya TaxID=153742 RepID=A0ABD2YZ08_9GENT
MAAKEMEMDSLISAAAVGMTSMFCVLISPLNHKSNSCRLELAFSDFVRLRCNVCYEFIESNGVIIVVTVGLMSICTAPRDQVLNRRCRRLSLRRSAGMDHMMMNNLNFDMHGWLVTAGRVKLSGRDGTDI